jgi:hypothetical protein
VLRMGLKMAPRKSGATSLVGALAVVGGDTVLDDGFAPGGFETICGPSRLFAARSHARNVLAAMTAVLDAVNIQIVPILIQLVVASS